MQESDTGLGKLWRKTQVSLCLSAHLVRLGTRHILELRSLSRDGDTSCLAQLSHLKPRALLFPPQNGNVCLHRDGSQCHALYRSSAQCSHSH